SGATEKGSSAAIALRKLRPTTPTLRPLCQCTKGAGKSWPSSFLRSCGLFDDLFEAGVAILHAIGHAGVDGAVTRFLRRERHVADEHGDAVLLAQIKRHDARIAHRH